MIGVDIAVAFAMFAIGRWLIGPLVVRWRAKRRIRKIAFRAACDFWDEFGRPLRTGEPADAAWTRRWIAARLAEDAD